MEKDWLGFQNKQNQPSPVNNLRILALECTKSYISTILFLTG